MENTVKGHTYKVYDDSEVIGIDMVNSYGIDINLFSANEGVKRNILRDHVHFIVHAANTHENLLKDVEIHKNYGDRVTKECVRLRGDVEELREALIHLKHNSNHTIEEEMWRIDEALSKTKDGVK